MGRLGRCNTHHGLLCSQAVKVIQTRDTASISLWMYILFTAGIACWLAYGLIIGDVPMTAANAITLVLATIILVTKVRNG